jgi:hypothetical protein
MPCAKAQIRHISKLFNTDAAELTAHLEVLSNFVERQFNKIPKKT